MRFCDGTRQSPDGVEHSGIASRAGSVFCKWDREMKQGGTLETVALGIGIGSKAWISCLEASMQTSGVMVCLNPKC